MDFHVSNATDVFASVRRMFTETNMPCDCLKLVKTTNGQRYTILIPKKFDNI